MSILHTNEDGTFFNEALLQLVEEKNNVVAASFLKDHSMYHQLRDSEGMTLLHFSAAYGNTEFAEHLISMGADVNSQDHVKRTPLMLAIVCKREATVRTLLKVNADIFMPDVDGQCALAKAFRKDGPYRDINILQALLDEVTVDSLRINEYVESESFHENCPLYGFVKMDNVEVIKILLEKGSPVDAKCLVTGETALHCAANLPSSEMVKLLLKYKADVNAKTRNGKTALSLVGETRPEDAVETIKILISAGAVLINRYTREIMVNGLLGTGSKEMVRALFQSGFDLKFVEASGKTALHYLASNKQPHIFEALQDYDFDVHLRDERDRQTMLHWAASTGRPNFITFLLDHGADVNARDDFDNTPLRVAVLNYYYNGFGLFSRGTDRNLSNDLNCIELLLEYGADTSIFVGTNRDYEELPDQVLAPIFVTIALLEASGREIDKITLQQIDFYPRLQELFVFVKMQLEQMKQIPISQHSSLTFYDFITASDKISRFARNQQLVSDLTVTMKEYNGSLGYYHRRLHRLYLKFNQLAEWRVVTLAAVNDVFAKFRDDVSVDLVTEKIVDYLLDKKWRETVSTSLFRELILP